MINLELVIDPDCPNADAARTLLKQAFQIKGQEPVWQEWDRSDPDCPDYAKNHGSPTILINGNDINDVASSDSKSCRVYQDNDGNFTGIPPLSLLLSKMRDANPE